MALTVDELRARQAADLQRLVARLMAARRADDRPGLDRALADMVDFGVGTPFSELRAEAERARSAAVADIAAVALDELAAVADRATRAGAGFKAAALVAASGKKELLFPALAATAANTTETIKQFQAAIEAVRSTVANVDELGDVPDAVAALLASLETLSGTLASKL